jgi:AcrR family transcriptional regulator
MKTEPKKSGKNRIQRRADRTREKLKEAALDIFSEKSVHAVTVEEITDKEQIIVTLVEEAVEHLIRIIRKYDSAPESLEAMLEHLLNAHYEFFVEAREEFLLLFQGKLLIKLESDTLDELEEPYLRYLKEIEEQVSIYLSPRIAPLKVRRFACAVAGFVFGFFSFAMIGMTSNEIEKSITPLRKVFVESLVTFLGR